MGRGLRDVRRAPIAFEFCVSAQFRNGPGSDMSSQIWKRPPT